MQKIKEDVPEFAETYKMAYSHGLESIYALENVDPRSIRRLNDPRNESKSETKPLKVQRKQPENETSQLEFDFGQGFRKWTTSFILDEPIQVLELTRHAEKCLSDHGKCFLKDLVHFDLREFVFFKGMGQGHIDEVRQKLNNYLAGKELDKTTSIDFASWLRCLAAASNRKKIHVCLHEYDLADLLTLMPSESMEIRRLTDLKRAEWVDEAFCELRDATRTQFVYENMRAIVNAFIGPWMRLRMGFATIGDILERMERISDDAALVEKSLQLFGDAYFSQRFPPGEFLYEACEGIYAVDDWHQQAYFDIIAKALTYFYRPRTYYGVDELVSWLGREFAKGWQGYPDGMIERVLRLSPHFSIWKGENGRLSIMLA